MQIDIVKVLANTESCFPEILRGISIWRNKYQRTTSLQQSFGMYHDIPFCRFSSAPSFQTPGQRSVSHVDYEAPESVRLLLIQIDIDRFLARFKIYFPETLKELCEVGGLMLSCECFMDGNRAEAYLFYPRLISQVPGIGAAQLRRLHSN